jgi:hypothetical protein
MIMVAFSGIAINMNKSAGKLIIVQLGYAESHPFY